VTETDLPSWLEGLRGKYLPKLIESDSRVIRVIAGPGAGKTTGLKRMVQRLIEDKKVEASKVFVGTFTRVIAKDLSEKLGDGIGKDLSISTIHSLSLRLLRDHPEACRQYELRFLLGFEEDAMHYDVATTIDNTGTIHDRRKTLKRIQSDWAERQSLRDAAFWGEADRWLRRHGGMLIGEVVPLATSALEANDVPRGYFDYVIVDEYQDLTACEQKLIELIWSENGSLVVLGDDDQSIYSFRYNHPGGVSEFAAKWPEDVLQDTPLPENHRSGTAIVSLANIMMASAGSSKPPMIPQKGEDGNVAFLNWFSSSKEIDGLANYVRLHEDTEFLILVPRRFIGYRLKAAIGTDARTSFYQQVLESPYVQECFAAASLIANPCDSVSTRSWLSFKKSGGEFAPNHNADAYSTICGATSSVGLDLLREIVNDSLKVTGAGSTHIKNRAKQFIQLYDSMPEQIEDQIKVLFNPSSADVIQDEEKQAQVSDDLSLLREALLNYHREEPSAPLSDLMDNLRYRIATRTPLADDDSPCRVRIMTLHSAKGLEADVIIVAGASDQIIPGPSYGTADEKEHHREEQRRLLYVSLTRARQHLIVSWPSLLSYDDAKKNNIRTDSTFRKRDGSLAVRLTKSSLLPDVTGIDYAQQTTGASWLKEQIEAMANMEDE
jgi:ATP-dependent DNA helicase UvrD/PcrA